MRLKLLAPSPMLIGEPARSQAVPIVAGIALDHMNARRRIAREIDNE